MNIVISKHLFSSYCGLVKSGYSLTDINDLEIKNLYDRIHTVHFPQTILKYFSLAKTNQTKVNPYYPRGSDISVACFFFNKPIEKFTQFLKSCGSLDLDDKEYINWISQLKRMVEKIESLPEYESLFNEYQLLAEKRCAKISQQINATYAILKEYGFASDITITFAPNFLQSKYLADFALVDNNFYIIATDFTETAVIHEYLHTFFANKSNLFRNIIYESSIDKFVDTSAMIKNGYMQNNSIESQCHVLEDCISRAIAGALATDITICEYCKTNTDMGFLSVPDMLKYFKTCNKSQNSINEIILEATHCFK